LLARPWIQAGSKRLWTLKKIEPPDANRISHIRYETALLQALSDKQAPFLLPLPIRANNGDAFVLFEQETKEWDLIDILGSVYQAHFPLSEEELLALPDIWRLRDGASLIHRMGRYVAGQETDARIQNRIEHSLWREAWLSGNREALVRHALTW
jgi:Ser/Thr protein kinase RdoA (MazF antagonist)